MIKLEVKLPNITKAFDVQRKLREKDILRSLVNDLKRATPVNTGEASNGWRLGSDSIYNNVEYIEDLNKGSSKQAGPRFIERTVLATGKILPIGKMVSSR